MSKKCSSNSIRTNGATFNGPVLLTALVAASIATLGAERTAAAFSWTSTTISSQTIDVANLSNLGANAVTIAPYSRTGLFLLGGGVGQGDGNGNWKAYSCVYNAMAFLEECTYTSRYLYVLEDGYAGTMYGLDGFTGDAYYRTGVWNVTSWGTGHYWASIAPTGSGTGFITDGDNAGCGSDSPSGACIDQFTSNTAQGAFSDGAYQVTIDSRTGRLDALSSDNTVWYYTGGAWTHVTKNLCAGGTVTFDQIAGKDSTIFGVTDNSGSGGTVYYWTSGNGCWGAVGPKTNFALSIATDPVASEDGVGTHGFSVWATDNSNKI